MDDGKKDKIKEISSFIFKFIQFSAAVVVIYYGLTLNPSQLKDLTVKAKIDPDFVIYATSTITSDEIFSFRLYVNPLNIGDYSPSEWYIVVMFLSDVTVNDVSQGWMAHKDYHVYTYIGEQKLWFDFGLINRIEDSVGWFDISIPSSSYKLDLSKNKLDFTKRGLGLWLPFAVVYTGGERTEKSKIIVYFDYVKGQFVYKGFSNLIDEWVFNIAPKSEEVIRIKNYLKELRQKEKVVWYGTPIEISPSGDFRFNFIDPQRDGWFFAGPIDSENLETVDSIVSFLRKNPNGKYELIGIRNKDDCDYYAASVEIEPRCIPSITFEYIRLISD